MAANIDRRMMESRCRPLGADMWHVGAKLDASVRLSCAIRSRCASDPSLNPQQGHTAVAIWLRCPDRLLDSSCEGDAFEVFFHI